MYRIILHARSLLSNWTNDATAVDAEGNPCDLQDGVAFDAYGAVARAVLDLKRPLEDYRSAIEHLRQFGYLADPSYTHQDVLRIFDTCLKSFSTKPTSPSSSRDDLPEQSPACASTGTATGQNALSAI